jgi:hypothetical protein
VSTWKKSAARIVLACASRNARQVCPDRVGAGSMLASLRICHTVDGASLYPNPVSSPWIRRYPQDRLSRAISSTSAHGRGDQTELADADGVCQARMSKIEHGEISGIDAGRAYGAALGGTIDVVARLGDRGWKAA